MSDDFFLRNRSTIAIITGGTQGLGLAIARRLAMEGAQGVVLSGRRLDKGEKAAASIQFHGTDCIFVKADVSIPEDCVRLVATALERFGTVNGLVNAAALPDRGYAAGHQPRALGPSLQHQCARPVPVDAGDGQTPGRNRPTGQHRQHSFNGGPLRAVLPGTVFGV